MDQPIWALVLVTIVFTLLFSIMDIGNTSTIKQDTFENVRAANQNALLNIQEDYNDLKELGNATLLEEWIISYCNNNDVNYEDIEINFVQIKNDPPTFLVSVNNDAGSYAIIPQEAMVKFYSGSTVVSKK